MPVRSAAPIRRYHFHLPGLIYVLVTFFIAVGALNSQNNLLFAALGIAIGGLIASGLVSGSALMGVRLEREPVSPGSVGHPLVLRYTLRNVNRLMPVFGLHVEEVVGNPASPSTASNDPADTATHRSPLTGHRSLPDPSAILRSAHAFVAHIGPGDLVRASSAVRPTRRGEARSTGVIVWSSFPFGLVKKSITFPLERTVEVRPAALPIRRGLIRRLTARAASGLGAERSAGAGDEFFSLREYHPGDNPRRIAWRATARTGQLVVRQHASPAPVRLWVVLRLGAQAQGADERAVALAASLLRHAASDEVAIGLAIPGAGVVRAPGLERRRLEWALGLLARLDPAAARARGPERFPEQAARAGRGAACIVVHAAPLDRAFGPRHAHHLDATRPGSWIEGSDDARALLDLVARAEAAP